MNDIMDGVVRKAVLQRKTYSSNFSRIVTSIILGSQVTTENIEMEQNELIG